MAAEQMCKVRFTMEVSEEHSEQENVSQRSKTWLGQNCQKRSKFVVKRNGIQYNEYEVTIIFLLQMSKNIFFKWFLQFFSKKNVFSLNFIEYY